MGSLTQRVLLNPILNTAICFKHKNKLRSFLKPYLPECSDLKWWNFFIDFLGSMQTFDK